MRQTCCLLNQQLHVQDHDSHMSLVPLFIYCNTKDRLTSLLHDPRPWLVLLDSHDYLAREPPPVITQSRHYLYTQPTTGIGVLLGHSDQWAYWSNHCWNTVKVKKYQFSLSLFLSLRCLCTYMCKKWRSYFIETVKRNLSFISPEAQGRHLFMFSVWIFFFFLKRSIWPWLLKKKHHSDSAETTCLVRKSCCFFLAV